MHINAFQKVELEDNFYDVAISNVPFGNHPVFDKRYNKENFKIHDYFFAKALDKVRTNGIVAFITTKGTMDKMSSNVREYIAKRANLLGAIRLPTNSFANTEVTTDIIFLQKREQIREELPSWVKTEEYDEGININKYFIDHPEMVMGEFHKVSNQYGKFDFDVVNKDGNLNEMLEEAINKLPHDIFKQEEISIENKEDKVIPATGLKNQNSP